MFYRFRIKRVIDEIALHERIVNNQVKTAYLVSCCAKILIYIYPLLVVIILKRRKNRVVGKRTLTTSKLI